MTRSSSISPAFLSTSLLLGPPSLATPSLRTVLVVGSAWRNPEDSGLWITPVLIFPVVAFESVTYAAYYRRPTANGRHPARATHAELLNDGWHFDHQDVERRIVFADTAHSGELTTLEDYKECWVVDAHTVVTCDWPSSEDASRLEPFKQAVARQAIKSAERDEQHEREEAARAAKTGAAQPAKGAVA